MNFDWPQFLTTHSIEFHSSGKSVARGNVNIHCPFCGDADQGFHLGLALEQRRPYWACWRNPEHRGRNPARLIMRLLGCTKATADSYLAANDYSSLERYEQIVQRLAVPLQPPPPLEKRIRRSTQLPHEFYPLDEGRHRHKYIDYLEGRGFADVASHWARYDLHYCLTGYFARRLVLPIYRDGELLTWTARDITGHSSLRYRTLSDKPDTARSQGYAPARGNIKDTLYNWDRAQRGGRTLILCEGPLDALKLNWYANQRLMAVAFFGMPTPGQIALTLELSHRFEQIVLTLDRDAGSQAYAVREQLQGLVRCPVRWERLAAKDPGELTESEANAFFRALDVAHAA